jgi:hypothetical protein
MAGSLATPQRCLHQPPGNSPALMLPIHEEQEYVAPFSHSQHPDDLRIAIGHQDKVIKAQLAFKIGWLDERLELGNSFIGK